MLQISSKISFKKLIPITLLKEVLITQLSKRKDSENFLCANSISFCNLTPMRSIPFRVICLIGMNKEEFPRYNSLDNSNLVDKYSFYYKNYNSYEEDKYLFLETLLSARDYFFVSFTGSTVKHIKNLSIVVEDLLDYVLKSFFLSLKKEKNFGKNTAQNNLFSHVLKIHQCTQKNELCANIKNDHKTWSFSVSNYIDNNHKSFFNICRNKNIQFLSIKDLLCFYKHPVRFWFHKNLKINFSIVRRNTFKNNFLSSLKMKGLFFFRSFLLDFLIYKSIDEISYEEKNLINFFLNKTLKSSFWEEQYKNILCVANQVKFFKGFNEKDFLISQSIYNKKISGVLKNVQSNGLLRWRPYKLTMKDILQLWIEHLLYCISGGIGTSRIFGIQSAWSFFYIEVQKAKEFLSYLIDGYFLGIKSPLILLNRSGSIWLKCCYNIKTGKITNNPLLKKIATEKIIQSWEGNDFIIGEKEDPYLQKVIPNLKKDNITEIICNIKKYYLLPFSLRKKI